MQNCLDTKSDVRMVKLAARQTCQETLQTSVACHVRCVHTSINSSFSGVSVEQLFPLTSELRGESGGHRVTSGGQGC